MKDFIKKAWMFWIVLAVLAISGIALVYNMYMFNSMERTMLIDETGGDALISIAPRGGATDTWIKRQQDEDGNEIIYDGVIYDLTISNHSSWKMNSWSLQITMPEDCYVNNAWCGKIEFHQDVASKEKSQTLDLRTCTADGTEYTVNALLMDNDLMIPMNKGDYIIYLPSETDKENEIRSVDYETTDYPYVTSGFIIYYDEANRTTPIEFTDGVLTYTLHMDFLDSVWAKIWLVAIVLWIMGFISYIFVSIKMKKMLEKVENDARIIKESMSAFMGFIDAKDPYTNGHSRRVAAYSKKLALKYGLSEEQAQKIYYMGLMHDCGKIGVPDSILTKPGKLTDEEYRVIQTHTTIGGKILENFTSIEYMKEAAMYHHERYDGKGYPSHLKGEEIPLVARIICVADSFDAMNSNRCYRAHLTPEEIVDQIEKNKGTQFDPKIADCLLELLKEGSIHF